jgi:dienelactone hydrolase
MNDTVRGAKWYIAAILVAAIGAAYVPVCNLVFAVRLVAAVKSLASGSTAQDLPVLVEKIARRHGNQDLESLVYRSERHRPEHAVVLVAGISELGCYHPRLIALSRSIADKGFLVVTPDIRMFRQFRMGPEALDEIYFWFEQAWTLETGGNVRQVGLAGISFSGTLALITAARPEIRDRVAWVLGIGAYDDPLHCSREWFAAGPITVGPGYFPTRFYAKWIIMLAALDMLPSEEERRYLQAVLVDLLLQRQVPAPPAQMSPEAGRWYRLALMREDQEDPELARQIETYLTPILYAQVTPDRAAAEVRCPVFLVHGAQDDLIPPEESRRLHQRIGARSHLLVSPFLTHTHPNDRSLSWREKAKAALDILGFFYSFARVVR